MKHAMIMAGGSGTRLWPMSRGDTPKQLIGLFKGTSLLEIAAERLEGTVEKSNRWICAGEKHADTIAQKVSSVLPTNLIGEPEGRDTLNAVGLTATVLQHGDPDAIFAVLTADHIITPQDEFARCLELGFKLVEEDPNRFITFGITPTYPATGYGYVELGDEFETGAFACNRFVEKPDEQTAKGYIDAGNFAWNSGMFIFHAGTFLKTLAAHQPSNAMSLAEIGKAWGTSTQNEVLNRVYPTLSKISVDYGMMEPASGDDAISICTIPMRVDWLDVGSWPSYGETLESDDSGNKSDGHAVHIDSSNVLCVSDDPTHTITTIGCENLIIVHTKDATLVFPASEAQKVKEMHNKVDPSLQ